jgi:hypothetical protein
MRITAARALRREPLGFLDVAADSAGMNPSGIPSILARFALPAAIGPLVSSIFHNHHLHYQL